MEHVLSKTILISQTIELIAKKYKLSIEEARNAKKRINNKILAKELCFLSYDNYAEKEKEIKSKFNQKLKYYNKLEELIEKQTPYLNVNTKPKRQTIIVSNDDGLNEMYTSLYQYINLLRYENYLVYSLDKDNYDSILNKTDKYCKYNCKLLLVNDKESGITKIVGATEEKYLKDQVIVDRADGFKTPTSYNSIIYTMENYQEFLDSYHYNEKTIKLSN